MIISLCGPTDLYNLRRTKLAEAFCKKVFFFDDLTVQFLEKMPVTLRGRTYQELLEQQDRVGVMSLKQKVEDAIRAVNPRIYTDWMTNQLASKAFSQGLKISTKVTEAVVGDVKYEDWARFLKRFGTDKNNRTNRAVFIPSPGLPAPLCDHPSETDYERFGYDMEFDVDELDIGKAVNKVRSSFYLNRSEE